ncbi:hypothetical protein EX530_14000 [Xanthomonas phaseoli]|nr:hypothetical protein XabCFBP2524_15295 [Xanthomonas axonopodis pv. begoniae]
MLRRSLPLRKPSHRSSHTDAGANSALRPARPPSPAFPPFNAALHRHTFRQQSDPGGGTAAFPDRTTRAKPKEKCHVLDQEGRDR